MVLRRGNSEILNLSSILFLSLALILTIFSIFYADWRYSGATGYSVSELPGTNPPTCPLTDTECFTICRQCRPPSCPSYCNQIPNYENPTNEPGSQSGSYSNNYNPPPQSVISEISRTANILSQSAAIYSRNVDSIMEQSAGLPESELIIIRNQIRNNLINSFSDYRAYSEGISKYSSDELDKSHSEIIKAFNEINDLIKEIDLTLSEKTEELVEAKKEQAEWTSNRKEILVESSEELENYIVEVIPSSVEVSENNLPSKEIITESNCEYPVYLSSLGDVVDFGRNGIDSTKGDICELNNHVVYDAAASSPDMKDFVVKDFKVVSDYKNFFENQAPVALHFEERGESNYKQNVGLVIIRDKNNLPNFRFFSSPNYYDVEQKIFDFINNLFFKGRDVDALSLSAMTSQEAELIVNERRFVPWALWSVLSLMIISFLFFERFLTPPHRKLISSGRTALSNGDYYRAVEIYNKLTKSNYSDSLVKQDILDYFVQLKRKIGESKISLSSHKNPRDLLRINHVSNMGRHFSESVRVEKMIRDSLHEISHSPKVALSRMPIVVDAYKRLDSTDREKLASLYESLVYKLRDLRR